MNYFLNMTPIQFQHEQWKVELWVTSTQKNQEPKNLVISFLKLYAFGSDCVKTCQSISWVSVDLDNTALETKSEVQYEWTQTNTWSDLVSGEKLWSHVWPKSLRLVADFVRLTPIKSSCIRTGCGWVKGEQEPYLCKPCNWAEIKINIV